MRVVALGLPEFTLFAVHVGLVIGSTGKAYVIGEHHAAFVQPARLKEKLEIR